jgi:hypothetical protein
MTLPRQGASSAAAGAPAAMRFGDACLSRWVGERDVMASACLDSGVTALTTFGARGPDMRV